MGGTFSFKKKMWRVGGIATSLSFNRMMDGNTIGRKHKNVMDLSKRNIELRRRENIKLYIDR